MITFRRAAGLSYTEGGVPRMAALSAIVPTKVGATYALAAVAASDTIASSLLGTLGAHLIITNGGGSPDVVAISDSGLTPAGQAGASTGDTVTNGTSQVFFISPKQVDPVSGNVTVTHSFITTVTYALLPIG